MTNWKSNCLCTTSDWVCPFSCLADQEEISKFFPSKLARTNERKKAAFPFPYFSRVLSIFPVSSTAVEISRKYLYVRTLPFPLVLTHSLSPPIFGKVSQAIGKSIIFFSLFFSLLSSSIPPPISGIQGVKKQDQNRWLIIKTKYSKKCFKGEVFLLFFF